MPIFLSLKSSLFFDTYVEHMSGSSALKLVSRSYLKRMTFRLWAERTESILFVCVCVCVLSQNSPRAQLVRLINLLPLPSAPLSKWLLFRDQFFHSTQTEQTKDVEMPPQELSRKNKRKATTNRRVGTAKRSSCWSSPAPDAETGALLQPATPSSRFPMTDTGRFFSIMVCRTNRTIRFRNDDQSVNFFAN